MGSGDANLKEKLKTRSEETRRVPPQEKRGLKKSISFPTAPPISGTAAFVTATEGKEEEKSPSSPPTPNPRRQ